MGLPSEPGGMGKRDLESTIYIVDLAGSERQSKTGVTGEQAIRLGHPALVATLMRPPPLPALRCPLPPRLGCCRWQGGPLASQEHQPGADPPPAPGSLATHRRTWLNHRTIKCKPSTKSFGELQRLLLLPRNVPWHSHASTCRG